MKRVSSLPLVKLIKVNFIIEVDKEDLQKWMKKMSWKLPFKSYLKNFFYLIGQRVYLSIKVGKKVSKGAFSVIQLIFADSRISLCHCHQTCLTTTTTYFRLTNVFWPWLYLKKLVMIAHLGNDLWWALEQAMACSMTIISWIFKVIRKTWQIRKTPTIPMKTMAKLSSVLLRAWWLIVAWLLLWRRRSCLSLMSL